MNNQLIHIEDILKSLKRDNEINPSGAFRTNARIRILNTIAHSTGSPQVRQSGVSPVVYAFRIGFLSLFLMAGTVYAAQSSNPRDVLFPVKILSEQVALTLSPSDSTRTHVAMTIIGRRVTEAVHAKNDGDKEEEKETIANYQSSVLQIRSNRHVDHDTIEQEIEKHHTLFRESEDSGDKKRVEGSGELEDVKGEHIDVKSSEKSEDSSLKTSSSISTDEQKSEEYVSPTPKSSESLEESDSGHDGEDASSRND